MRALFTAVVLATAATATTNAQVPPPPVRGGDAYEVLARGPVHEGFAAVADGATSAPPVVQVPPPPPVAELPPEVKPAGDDVEWLGGYWHWSDVQNGYVWVSGCWRDAPPGRDWLPGRWVRVADGFQWVSGTWLPEGTTQLTLLPPPPAPVEEDPGPAPTPTSMFVPGTWVWRGDRYLWRAGQWVEQPQEWVWQPAQYVWTPSGCVSVDGYWDHPFEERGLLFAPAVFRTVDPVALRRVTFVPQYVVRPNFLENALFARAATRHYYFGDYFEPRYRQSGYLPWFDYRTSRAAVDPLYAHSLAYRRADGWEQALRTLYQARYAGQAVRPPRTWAQQDEVVRSVAKGVAADAQLPPEAERVAPLVSVRANDAAEVQQAVRQLQTASKLQVERVADEQKARYRAAADQRQAAVKAVQEEFAKRVQQQGNAAVAPKAPVQLDVPTLPKAARTAAPVPTKAAPAPMPMPMPMPMPKGQPKQPDAPPPMPQPKKADAKPPTPAPTQSPVPPRSQGGRKGPPPQPMFQPEREGGKDKSPAPAPVPAPVPKSPAPAPKPPTVTSPAPPAPGQPAPMPKGKGKDEKEKKKEK